MLHIFSLKLSVQKAITFVSCTAVITTTIIFMLNLRNNNIHTITKMPQAKLSARATFDFNNDVDVTVDNSAYEGSKQSLIAVKKFSNSYPAKGLHNTNMSNSFHTKNVSLKNIANSTPILTDEMFLLSLSKPVVADVRGNLGPPTVVTNENVSDWLKDRWQGNYSYHW